MSETTLNDRVAEEIRVAIARRRMTASELARKAGMTQRSISRRITGEKSIDMEDLERIAQALEVDVSDLLPAAGRSDQRATRSSPASATRPSADRPTPVRICAGTIPRQADTTTANRRTHRTPARRPAIRPWTHDGVPA